MDLNKSNYLELDECRKVALDIYTDIQKKTGEKREFNEVAF